MMHIEQDVFIDEDRSFGSVLLGREATSEYRFFSELNSEKCNFFVCRPHVDGVRVVELHLVLCMIVVSGQYLIKRWRAWHSYLSIVSPLLIP